MARHFVSQFHHLLQNTSNDVRRLVELKLFQLDEKIRLAEECFKMVSQIQNKKTVISGKNKRLDSLLGKSIEQNVLKPQNTIEIDHCNNLSKIEGQHEAMHTLVSYVPETNQAKPISVSSIVTPLMKEIMYISRRRFPSLYTSDTSNENTPTPPNQVSRAPPRNVNRTVSKKTLRRFLLNHCNDKNNKPNVNIKNAIRFNRDDSKVKRPLSSITNKQCNKKSRMASKTEKPVQKTSTRVVPKTMLLRSNKTNEDMSETRKLRNRSVNINLLHNNKKSKVRTTKMSLSEDLLKKRKLSLQQRLNQKRRLKEERIVKYRDNRQKLQEERLKKFLKTKDHKIRGISKIPQKSVTNNFITSSGGSKRSQNTTTTIINVGTSHRGKDAKTFPPQVDQLEKNPHGNNYELSPLRNSNESEPSSIRKPIPSWAKGLALKKALYQQFQEPSKVDKLFGKLTKTIKVMEVFGSGAFKERTSSAIWSDSSYDDSTNGVRSNSDDRSR